MRMHLLQQICLCLALFIAIGSQFVFATSGIENGRLKVGSLRNPEFSLENPRSLQSPSRTCLNVSFVTPYMIGSNGPCSFSNLTPDYPMPTQGYVTLQGKLLDPICYNGPGCTIQLCDEELPADGFLLVESTKPDWWGYQLYANNNILQALYTQCNVVNPLYASSCTCGYGFGYWVDFVSKCAMGTTCLYENPVAYYYVGKIIEDDDDDDTDVNASNAGNNLMVIGGATGAAVVGLALIAAIAYASRRRRIRDSNDGANSDILAFSDIPRSSPPSGGSSKVELDNPVYKSTSDITGVNSSSPISTVPPPLNVKSQSSKHLKRTPKYDKNKLAARFQSFVSSTPQSELGSLLKGRLSGRASVVRSDDDSLLSKNLGRSTIDEIDVDSYKKSVNSNDKSRFSKLKESARFTGHKTISSKNAHFSESEQLQKTKKKKSSQIKHASGLVTSTSSDNNSKMIIPMASPDIEFESVISNPRFLPSVYSSVRSDPLNRTSLQLYKKGLQLITSVCEQLWQETLDEEQANATDFYSGCEPPQISLEDYIYRMAKGLDRWFYDSPSVQAVGIRSFLIALIYLDKIKKKEPNFTLTTFNRHRIFAVTMLIAAKFTEDALIVNSYWAKVCGVDVEDLNEMEEQFCNTSGFEFWISNEQLEKLYDEYHLSHFIPTSLSGTA